MNTWTEILVENESDARSAMDNESCQSCGVPIRDHYNRMGCWVACKGGTEGVAARSGKKEA